MRKSSAFASFLCAIKKPTQETDQTHHTPGPLQTTSTPCSREGVFTFTVRSTRAKATWCLAWWPLTTLFCPLVLPPRDRSDETHLVLSRHG